MEHTVLFEFDNANVVAFFIVEEAGNAFIIRNREVFNIATRTEKWKQRITKVIGNHIFFGSKIVSSAIKIPSHVLLQMKTLQVNVIEDNSLESVLELADEIDRYLFSDTVAALEYREIKSLNKVALGESGNSHTNTFIFRVQDLLGEKLVDRVFMMQVEVGQKDVDAFFSEITPEIYEFVMLPEIGQHFKVHQ